jgi:hypothetical protein
MTPPKQPVSWHDSPPSDDEAVAKLRLQLRHLSLLELVKREYLSWNKNEETVTKGPKFDERPPEREG